MAVYIVTGKLGAGKTLLLVQRILIYLKAGRRVAVNIDVHMNKFCKAGNRHSRVVRLPDLPTADDLVGLEYGCEQYDEEKFGGIFLDEAGVWLNSRDWNKNGRTDLLKFFLFLRKRRWDLWLCVQNVNVIDKQVRESIAEHVVYINRWDKLKIPAPIRIPLQILSLGFFKGKLPKVHQAVVKLGAKFNSPKVEDWFYRGEDFYSFYDTTQEYDNGYDKGSYSLLPPGYWRRPLPAALRSMGFYMRLTKIYFRRFGVINSFFVGFFASLILSFTVFSGYLASVSMLLPSDDAPSLLVDSKLSDEFEGYRVVSFSQGSLGPEYLLLSPSGDRVLSSDLVSKGVEVKPRGSREVLLVRGSDFVSITR